MNYFNVVRNSFKRIKIASNKIWYFLLNIDKRRRLRKPHHKWKYLELYWEVYHLITKKLFWFSFVTKIQTKKHHFKILKMMLFGGLTLNFSLYYIKIIVDLSF